MGKIKIKERSTRPPLPQPFRMSFIAEITQIEHLTTKKGRNINE